MKKAIILFVLLAAVQLMAQDKVNVTIKASDVSGGVVVLLVHQADAPVGHTVQLQCNKGMLDCKTPKNGEYMMVRLPKNYGTYDCVDVDLYPLGADPDNSDKIGEYCLIEK